jgi:hypothetical protein
MDDRYSILLIHVGIQIHGIYFTRHWFIEIVCWRLYSFTLIQRWIFHIWIWQTIFASVWEVDFSDEMQNRILKCHEILVPCQPHLMCKHWLFEWRVYCFLLEQCRRSQRNPRQRNNSENGKALAKKNWWLLWWRWESRSSIHEKSQLYRKRRGFWPCHEWHWWISFLWFK